MLWKYHIVRAVKPGDYASPDECVMQAIEYASLAVRHWADGDQEAFLHSWVLCGYTVATGLAQYGVAPEYLGHFLDSPLSSRRAQWRAAATPRGTLSALNQVALPASQRLELALDAWFLFCKRHKIEYLRLLGEVEYVQDH